MSLLACVMDELELSLNSSMTQAGSDIEWVLPDAVNTVKCSWQAGSDIDEYCQML